MIDFLLLAAILCCVALVAVYVNKRLLTLALSSVFILLVAMRLNIGTMYLMGTVLAVLPLASWAIGWYGARHIHVEMQAPDSATEGESVPVRLDVASPLPAFSLLAQPRCKLPHHLRMVDGSMATVPLAGGVRQEYRLVPDRRGVFNLDLATVLIHDPLGIFTIARRLRKRHPLVVYPTGLSMPEIATQGRQTGAWLLTGTLGRRGEDEGFYGTREYHVGDDIRRIHWLTSARRGSLVVAQRETRLQSTIWICLDVCRGTRRQTEEDPLMERAVKASVSLMEAALRRGDAVGLLARGTAETHIPPGVSEDQRWRILDALARMVADGDTPLSRVLEDVRVDPNATVAVVTSRPTQDMVRVAERLMAGGIRVALVAVGTDGTEDSPSYQIVLSAEAAGMETLCIPA